MRCRYPARQLAVPWTAAQRPWPGSAPSSSLWDIVTLVVDLEEDLVALQESLQALYVKNIGTLEGAAVKENWATAELTKLKGQVKEAHSRANCVIKQAKREKMKMLAKNRINRKESRVLIDNVDESLSNKVNSEESAVFVESVGGLLNSESPRLAILTWTSMIWPYWIRS